MNEILNIKLKNEENSHETLEKSNIGGWRNVTHNRIVKREIGSDTARPIPGRLRSGPA